MGPRDDQPVAALALLLLPWSPLSRISAPLPLAYLQTPLYLFIMSGNLMIAVWLWRHDRWLALGVGYVTLLACWRAQEVALWTAVCIGLGAAAVTAVRRSRIRYLGALLLASVAFEVLYASLQWLGWDPFVDWPNHAILPVGTFGNVRYLGALVAIVTPLAPLWLLPLFGLGLILSSSWLAVGAAVIGLIVKRARVAPLEWMALSFLGGAVFGALVMIRGLEAATLWTRGAVWREGLTDLAASPLAWVVGYGPGAWLTRIAFKQAMAHNPEVFMQAHSELFQWGYETGALGLILLAGWTLALQGRLPSRGPWTGAVAAAAVLALGLHILHWPTLAPAVLLVLGLAQRREYLIQERMLE